MNNYINVRVQLNVHLLIAFGRFNSFVFLLDRIYFQLIGYENS